MKTMLTITTYFAVGSLFSLGQLNAASLDQVAALKAKAIPAIINATGNHDIGWEKTSFEPFAEAELYEIDELKVKILKTTFDRREDGSIGTSRPETVCEVDATLRVYNYYDVHTDTPEDALTKVSCKSTVNDSEVDVTAMLSSGIYEYSTSPDSEGKMKIFFGNFFVFGGANNPRNTYFGDFTFLSTPDIDISQYMTQLSDNYRLMLDRESLKIEHFNVAITVKSK